MGFNEMLLALERESKEQNAETLERAKKQAEEIIAEANEAASGIVAREINKAQEQLRVQEAKKLLEAKFKAKKRFVEAKEKIVNEVFAEAEKRLQDLAHSTEYPQIFTNLAIEALQVIGDHESVVVNVSQKDAPLARSIFNKSKRKWQLKPVNLNSGGVVIASKDGRKVLTNTLESRLKRVKMVLHDKVGLWLFYD